MAEAGGRKYNFKVVLLGEGCVGKTSLVLRYVENKFNDKHITTLQVKVYFEELRYECVVEFLITNNVTRLWMFVILALTGRKNMHSTLSPTHLHLNHKKSKNR